MSLDTNLFETKSSVFEGRFQNTYILDIYLLTKGRETHNLMIPFHILKNIIIIGGGGGVGYCMNVNLRGNTFRVPVRYNKNQSSLDVRFFCQINVQHKHESLEFPLFVMVVSSTCPVLSGQ